MDDSVVGYQLTGCAAVGSVCLIGVNAGSNQWLENYTRRAHNQSMLSVGAVIELKYTIVTNNLKILC